MREGGACLLLHAHQVHLCRNMPERAALRRAWPPFAAIHTPLEFIRQRSLALLK